MSAAARDIATMVRRAQGLLPPGSPFRAFVIDDATVVLGTSVHPLQYRGRAQAARAMRALHCATEGDDMLFPVRLHKPIGYGIWYLAISPTPLEEARALVCQPHELGCDANGECALCRASRGVAEIEAQAEKTPDNRERLLYDLADVAGIIGQGLRQCPSSWCKEKGAELIALWRRAEHLRVLEGERP